MSSIWLKELKKLPQSYGTYIILIQDWVQYRNHPGMEYKDINKLLPPSFVWRTPSVGSEKPDPNYDSKVFKWDYKISYKSGPYYIRNKINPEVSDKDNIYTNIKIEAKDIDDYAKLIPDFKSILF
jgi:hypothetical protein